jgi:hypothetical protein
MSGLPNRPPMNRAASEALEASIARRLASRKTDG